MKNIKDVYNQIETWLKGQDKKKIKFLENESCYDDKSELGRLKSTLQYHYIMNEYKAQHEYLFGEKNVTLKDISKHMLDSMGKYGPAKGETKDDFDEDQLSCGYADTTMFGEIKSFWRNLDESALLSVASGSVMDEYEIDLDGYRCYFLSHSKVFPLIFNYIYYTLKKTPQELDEDLYNDNETFDEIRNLFPPEDLFLPDSSIVDKLYGKKYNEQTEKNLEDFERSINSILNNDRYNKEPELKDKIEALKQLYVNN